jgi:hypothetical protein
MSRITTDDPRPARGRQRQVELAAEMTHAVRVNSEAMLRGLGRPYSIGERFIAESISSLYLRAARLRDSGRDDGPVLRQAGELQQGSVFASRHPAAVPMPLIEPTA